MIVVMMTMTVVTCLPALATGKSCRPHALASLPLSLTYCTANPPIHCIVIQARLLCRLVDYTPKARFRDLLWSAYCTKDTCIPKIVLPGRLQALFNIRNLLLTSNCINLLESVNAAPKLQKRLYVKLAIRVKVLACVMVTACIIYGVGLFKVLASVLWCGRCHWRTGQHRLSAKGTKPEVNLEVGTLVAPYSTHVEQFTTWYCADGQWAMPSLRWEHRILFAHCTALASLRLLCQCIFN